MLPPPADAVIAALVEIAREEILTVFDTQSCIASTRIAIDVLAYFGVSAKPIPVTVTIFNDDARTLLEAEGLDAVTRAVWEQNPEEPGGPWTIGLGVQHPSHEPGPGHVAVAVPSQSMLVDLSLDQANRERKSIFLGPVALAVPDQVPFFTETGAQVAYTVRLADDKPAVTLIYEHASQHLYRKSLNWRRQGAERAGKGFKTVTAQIITRMKKTLAE